MKKQKFGAVKKPTKFYTLVTADTSGVKNTQVRTYDAVSARNVYKDVVAQDGSVLYGVRGDRGRFVA